MNSPADWRPRDSNNNTVPNSCCKEIPANSRCDSNSIHVYSDGCILKLKSAIENNAMILGGVGIGVALIQVSFNSNCYPLTLWFEVSRVKVYIKILVI